MTAFTLKSLPETLIESLRSAAERAHRSLNKEIIHRLERSFDKPATPMKIENWDEYRVNEQADAWDKLAGTWESDVSVEAEIEALYAARTPGREITL
ncbi:Arc family DNA-binding protein [Prosthecobacter sp. SYSU 5D2]|uniref:Arc family DNA-binding protein n=1 Tax=Prosthecobacter sp. SYSU 5D2 TaxID=3134134 RepID=UPI0031FE6C0E